MSIGKIFQAESEFWVFGSPRSHLKGTGAHPHQEPLEPQQPSL